MHMQLAKIAGAKQVIVSVPNPMRRQIALELGADKTVDPVMEDLAGQNSCPTYKTEDF